MPRYAALIHGVKSAYGAVIPDLPGCAAMGKSVEEAVRNAASAARASAAVAKADGVKLPPPRPIESLRCDPGVRDAIAEGAVIAIAPLVLDAGRPSGANLSLDAGAARSDR